MNWIKEQRIKVGLTQKEVSLKVGISQAMYSAIENFNRNPSVDVAKKIGKVLKVKWTEFYK